MVKTEYLELIRATTKLATDCELFKAKIETKSKIEAMTVKELRICLDCAKNLYTKQTQLLTTDFYHVVTMGKLSASQISEYTKIISKISATRPWIERMTNVTLSSIPNMEKSTSFELKSVPGIKLRSENNS